MVFRPSSRRGSLSKIQSSERGADRISQTCQTGRQKSTRISSGMLAKPTVFRFRRWLPGQVFREPKCQANPVFVTFIDGQAPQCLINIESKAHALGVDQIVDHAANFSFILSYPEMKKACFHRLSCWSECTDLNRGPLVPQTSALTRLSYTPTWADTSTDSQVDQPFALRIRRKAGWGRPKVARRPSTFRPS